MECLFLFYFIGYIFAVIAFGYLFYTEDKYFRLKNVLYCFLVGFSSWVGLLLLLYITLRKRFVK